MSICKACGGQVQWQRKGARWFCFNADGSDHWDQCSREKWRRISKEGQHFETQTSKGYIHDELGVKLYRNTTGLKRGAHYRRTGLCKACVPAWETCPKNCPDEFLQIRSGDGASSGPEDGCERR